MCLYAQHPAGTRITVNLLYNTYTYIHIDVYIREIMLKRKKNKQKLTREKNLLVFFLFENIRAGCADCTFIHTTKI